MRIMTEEPFAPVMPLLDFSKLDDVIAAANDTPYGLAAYVFTNDLTVATRMAEGLEAGIIGINDPVPATPQCPFGGMKESGLGRELGIEGLDAYLETKYVSIGLRAEPGGQPPNESGSTRRHRDVALGHFAGRDDPDGELTAASAAATCPITPGTIPIVRSPGPASAGRRTGRGWPTAAPCPRAMSLYRELVDELLAHRLVDKQELRTLSSSLFPGRYAPRPRTPRDLTGPSRQGDALPARRCFARVRKRGC